MVTVPLFSSTTHMAFRHRASFIYSSAVLLVEGKAVNTRSRGLDGEVDLEERILYRRTPSGVLRLVDCFSAGLRVFFSYFPPFVIFALEKLIISITPITNNIPPITLRQLII